jgi:hypothetical protein
MDDDRRESAVDSGRCDRLNRFVARRDQPHERLQPPRREQKKSKEKSRKSRRSFCLRPKEL